MIDLILLPLVLVILLQILKIFQYPLIHQILFFLVQSILTNKLNPPTPPLNHAVLFESRVLISLYSHATDVEMVKHLHFILTLFPSDESELDSSVLLILVDFGSKFQRQCGFSQALEGFIVVARNRPYQVPVQSNEQTLIVLFSEQKLQSAPSLWC